MYNTFLSTLCSSDHAILCHVFPIDMSHDKFTPNDREYVEQVVACVDNEELRDALRVLKGLAPAKEAEANVLTLVDLIS